MPEDERQQKVQRPVSPADFHQVSPADFHQVSPADARPRRSRFPQHLLAIPPPLKRVFDAVPLRTYAANDLPLRAPRSRREHVLHVFTTHADASRGRGRPSFNPGCLKWQTLLKFADIPFRTIPSSNHASPTGVLPFLQPASPMTTAGIDAVVVHPDPVPGNRLRRWLATQGSQALAVTDAPDDVRFELYTSLLEGPIRKAWLYQLYLLPANAPLVHTLYTAPSSSNALVQAALAQQLVAAASAELVKATGHRVVSARDLLRDADDALTALSTLLADDEWFFARASPGLYDASVFAYTHLILDRALGWSQNPLREALLKRENLLRHRERITVFFD